MVSDLESLRTPEATMNHVAHDNLHKAVNAALDDLANGGSAGTGNVVVTIGDSQFANGTATTATTKAYVNAGAMTWARQFSGQSIQYPIENNLSVGGTTWGAYDTQIAQALALNPDFIVADWGANDSNGGLTALNLAKTNAIQFINDCFDNGARPIFIPVAPRGDSATTAMFRWIESYNRWLMDLCAGRADLINTNGLPLHRTPICIDVAGYPDYTSTTGVCNPGMIGTDLLHKATGGGIYDGYQLAEVFARLIPANPTYYSSPYDIYDATDLINGSLLTFAGVNRGMFAGTGGSLTANGGITPTGSIAPNCQLTAAGTISSSGTTAVAYKENPREDGNNTGERQGIRLNSTGGGGASSEAFQFNIINGVQGIRNGWSQGDVIVVEGKMQIYSATGLKGISWGLREAGGTSPLTYSDGTSASNNTVGVSTEQYPQLLQPLVFKTPPLTIGASRTDLFITALMTMYGAGSGYDLDVVFSDLKPYKIN